VKFFEPTVRVVLALASLCLIAADGALLVAGVDELAEPVSLLPPPQAARPRAAASTVARVGMNRRLVMVSERSSSWEWRAAGAGTAPAL
jgi:hypothetical protein